MTGKNSSLFASRAEVGIRLRDHLSNKFNLFRRQLRELM